MLTHSRHVQPRTVGHHIRGQTLHPRPVLTSNNHRLAHTLIRDQNALDLTQLDPETTHLHLIITTTRILKQT
ncbi:hypothetical protein ACF1BP_37325, partial [Streptomyces sp. NPDC014735]|uniref:hypothetical protein n=1 Tax=Streptomyces sp. NPDC014735 TaxID=3364887 RepID=UPI0036F9C9B6